MKKQTTASKKRKAAVARRIAQEKEVAFREGAEAARAEYMASGGMVRRIPRDRFGAAEAIQLGPDMPRRDIPICFYGPSRGNMVPIAREVVFRAVRKCWTDGNGNGVFWCDWEPVR